MPIAPSFAQLPVASRPFHPNTPPCYSTSNNRRVATPSFTSARFMSGASPPSCVGEKEPSSSPSSRHPDWMRPDCQEFYKENLIGAIHCRKRVHLMRLCITHAYGVKQKVNTRAQFLEFGVHEGKDIARMAICLHNLDTGCGKRTCAKEDLTVLHGFDSFIGLPEDWANGQLSPDGSDMFKTGKFSTDGETPMIAGTDDEVGIVGGEDTKQSNSAPSPLSVPVVFHKGWFVDTLPGFFDTHPQIVAFAHADADLYSSTKTFLDEMCQRRLLVAGSIILFDEFWNYDGWRDGEYKAWCETVKKYNISFRYYAYHAPKVSKAYRCHYGYQSVAVYIEKGLPKE